MFGEDKGQQCANVRNAGEVLESYNISDWEGFVSRIGVDHDAESIVFAAIKGICGGDSSRCWWE